MGLEKVTHKGLGLSILDSAHQLRTQMPNRRFFLLEAAPVLAQRLGITTSQQDVFPFLHLLFKTALHHQNIALVGDLALHRGFDVAETDPDAPITNTHNQKKNNKEKKNKKQQKEAKAEQGPLHD